METRSRMRRRILVVDAHSASRKLLEAQLRLSGYEVFIAEDASSVRRLLYEVRPQVMIVDAAMPVRGMPLVAELLAETASPWLPVIFITRPVEAVLALVERVLAGERAASVPLRAG